MMMGHKPIKSDQNDNRKNDEKIDSQDVEVFFERYIAQIQKLAIAVDQL